MRRIEIELHDPYIKPLSKWASVGRTLREAASLVNKLYQSTDDAALHERAGHNIGELDAITPALEHLHMTARGKLWEDGDPGYVKDGLDTRVLIYNEGSWRAPAVAALPTMRIFLLMHGKYVTCEKCALNYDLVESNAVAWFAINVVPYSQDCHTCGNPIVKGWNCQLFNNPGDRT